MHEIVRWEGLELVIRSGSVDRENLEWMKDSLFRKSFESAEISPGDTVLDLGAHMGSFAILAAVRRPCRVVAFEPDAASLTLCRVNILLNSVEDSVSCYPFAVGGLTGKQMLYESTENWGHTIIKDGIPNDFLTGQTFQVNCLSLRDTFIYAGCDRCAFLKFNIEGAEFDMIENADDLTLRRIKKMVGETHTDIAGRSPDAMFLRLSKAGFALEIIPLGEDRAMITATQT